MDAREEKAAARSRWKKNQAYNYTSKHKFRKKGVASGNDYRRDNGALEPQGGTVALQEDEKQSSQPGQSSLDEDDYDEEVQGGDYEEWLTLYPAEPVAVLMRKRLALPDSDLLQFLGQEEGNESGSSLKKKEILDTHINLNDLEKVIGSMPLVNALDIGSDLQELMFGDVMQHPPQNEVRGVDGNVAGVSTPQLDRQNDETAHIAAINNRDPVVETDVSIDKEMESILHIDEKYRGKSAVDAILVQTQQTVSSAALLEADDQELDDFLDSLS